MKRCKKIAVLTCALAMGAASGLFAATDTQVFTVTVPSVSIITGPADQTITHDGTDANNAFSVQAWTVRQNPTLGSNVSFAVAQPFTHSATPTFKRDARLNLAIATSQTPAGWTVNKGTDTTDYAATISDNAADVTAISTAPGRATFNLTVSFITTDFDTLAVGSYSTTVTGTIAPN